MQNEINTVDEEKKMQATVLGSVFFIVGFLLAYVGIFRFKKSEKTLDLFTWLILTFIIVICVGSLGAGLLQIIHIPINIISVGVILLSVGGVFTFFEVKNKEKQKYQLDKWDIVYAVLSFIFIGYICGSWFTKNLDLLYWNSDAAVHYKNAMDVLRHQEVTNMYFAPLLNALVMEVCLPVVKEVFLFKVYILVDSFMFFFETLFFFVFVKDYIKTRWMKIGVIAVAYLYVWGFPMNSFILSFFYWAIGVMLIGFLLMMVRYYFNGEIKRNFAIICMMLTCATIPVTYMLFGPIAFIALFVALMAMGTREHKLFSKENVVLALKVFVVPTILAIYYCYFDYLRNMDIGAGEILQIKGGSYKELWIDFIWTAPFVIYMLIQYIKKKTIDENMIFTFVFGATQVVLICLAYKGYASSYYSSKFYFPLWFLFFGIMVQAIDEMWKNDRSMFITIAVMFVGIGTLKYGAIEERIVIYGGDITKEVRSNDFFHLYDYNSEGLQQRTYQFTSGQFEIAECVMEELSDTTDKPIPSITNIHNYATCYWYQGITGEDNTTFFGWEYSMEELKDKIAAREVDYFVIFKGSQIYIDNKKYFDSFERVLENADGFIAIVP